MTKWNIKCQGSGGQYLRIGIKKEKFAFGLK